MAISNTVLTTSPTAIFTSTGNNIVSLLYFCNTTGVTHTVNMYLVPNGGSATTSTMVYNNVAITASDTFVVSTEKIILSNGDAIYANANASSSITTTLGYMAI